MNNKYIFIVAYRNQEDKIKRCLNSIISNKRNDYGIIIIDDASDDNSINIVDEIISNITVPHLFIKNIRCPICGDSKYNKAAKRGYVFEKDGSQFYICHNNTPINSCPANTPIPVNKLEKYTEEVT